MKLLIAPRQTGKTTKLLDAARKTGGFFIVPTAHQAGMINRLLKINPCKKHIRCMTMFEYVSRQHYMTRLPVYIDELSGCVGSLCGIDTCATDTPFEVCEFEDALQDSADILPPLHNSKTPLNMNFIN